MTPKAPWSIRTYILLLVALASVPLLCIVLYSGREQQRLAQASDEQLAASQAVEIARLQERTVAEARQFLTTLAEFPQVKRQDAQACNELFRELLRQNPQFDNLLGATRDGDFYASGRPFFPHHARDRRYFQEALRSRRFATGEFVIARNTNRPAFHLALPILSGAGDVLQVLVLGLDLEKLGSILPVSRPTGLSFVLLDHEGSLLQSWPGRAAFGGAAYPSWPLPPARDGLVRLKEGGGALTTFGTQPLTLPGESVPYMTVLVNLPETANVARARQTLWRNLIALVAATLLATVAALVAGARRIIAPLDHLLAATRTFTEGERPAALELGPAPTELGQLAHAFQALTETSATREAQRLQAAAALRQSEARYRAMVSNAPMGIFHFNSQGVIQECNDGLSAILGTPKDLIPGFNMLRSLRNVDVLMAVLESLCGRQGVYEGPYAPVLIKGRTAQIRLLTYGICNEEGRFLGGAGMVEDISARVHADQALKESEARYQGLFKNSPDCIFWITAQEDGLFIVDSVNPAQEAAARLPAAEMVGRSLSAFFPADHANALEANYRRCVQEQRSITYEDRLDFLDGSPSYQTLLVPLADALGTVRRMVGISRDITQLKTAEEALRQAQKMESLGVLAGGIAHDFNNLLTAILGNLDLAIYKLPTGSPVVHHLENAEKTALKASELTKQMLAYSGKGHFVVKPHDLNRLVEEMTHLLQVSISKKVTLKCRLAEDLPAVEADSAQIQQVVMNLVTNASEAIADREGRISLSTRVLELSPGEAEATLPRHTLKGGPYVVLEVADTGCGMSPEVQAKIFDPFYTTKASGHGLGLSAMLGILRGHHAGIAIHSREGAGSTFRVFFPATGGPAPAAPPRQDAEEPLLQGTILLVDDEEIILEALAPALEAMGFCVLTARDGVEAVALYQEACQTIDLVLMDLTMPRMNGREAFQAMRQIRPDARVILTSGYNEQESLQHFIAKDLAGFLQKPFLLKDLRQVLQAGLQGAAV